MTDHADPDRSPPQSASAINSALWDRQNVGRQTENLSRMLEDVAQSATIQRSMELAVALMRLKPGDRALDVGCGTGAFLPQLASAVGPRGSVTAVDHSPEFLTDARIRVAGDPPGALYGFEVADAHKLPISDDAVAAAHTERVLIHLNNPNKAIAEMKRVVQPGGWIVCVEPDLKGMRLDHADTDAAQMLVNGFCRTIRNPAMGLELNRRFAEVGLVDREVVVLTEVEYEYLDAPHWAAAARTMVANGALSQERADRALDWLDASAAASTYASYCSMFIVAGRVPSR